MKNIKEIVDLAHYFSGDKGYIEESLIFFNYFISEKVPQLKDIVNKHLYRDIIRYFQSKVYTVSEYGDDAVLFEISEGFQKFVLDMFRKFDENNSDELLLNLLDLTGKEVYKIVFTMTKEI